jgi:NADPH oxidase
MSPLIENHSYVTQKMELHDIKKIVLHDTDSRDAITRLRARTHFGRPNVDKVFEGLRDTHPQTDIGVFYCGPKQLSNQINLACTEFTDSSGTGTRFFYGKGMVFDFVCVL